MRENRLYQKLTTNALLILTIALLGGVIGCSFSRDTSRQQIVKTVQEVSEKTLEIRREHALSHMIQGSVYDATGDYAKAILEYQEALQALPSPAIEYAISKDYSILGKHALAAQHGREAVRLDSMNVLYHQNLASIYLNAFQPEQAAGEFEKVVRIDSNNTEGWYNLARMYQAARPLRALEIYERIIDRNGENWEILLQMAEICTNLGRFDDAADKYKRMVELDPSNKALQRQLAETYARAGKPKEAIKVLEKILEADDNNAEALATLADVYMEQEEYAKAMTLYEKLLTMERTNPEVRLRVGVAYVGQMQRDSSFIGKAKPVFEKLSSDIPRDWRPYYYLGMIADREKKDSLANSYFEQVTRLAEWNSDAWYYVGSTYFEKGEFQKLVDAMERAKKASPNDSRMYFLLGLGYSRLEKNDLAIAALKRALELRPDDMNALSTLALTLDGLRRYEESDSLYERALKIDPTSHIILNNYGYSLAERGMQLERALEMALKAVTAEPENPSYLDTIGWVYFRLGRYTEARDYIAKAIAGEGSATVYEHMGDVLFKLGKKDEAEQYWKEALEKNANNQALRDKIARGSL